MKNDEGLESLKTQIDEKIKAISKEKVQQANVDYLGKLVDIKKDISKIEKMEGENMMYRGRDSYGTYDNYGNYGTYGGGRRRDSQGRYMEGGRDSYGRRYRGHDYIEDMADNYGAYMDNMENGRYGSPEASKALDFMLQSVEDFMVMLKKDASSQEEIEKIKRTARKIAEM